MAQQVEHILGKDEVGGSSPLSSSKSPCKKLQGLFSCFVSCVRNFAFVLVPPKVGIFEGGLDSSYK